VNNLVFTNGAWDTNFTHNHAKSNAFESFGGNVELTIGLDLNFNDTVFGILQSLGQAVPGVVKPTTSAGFIISNFTLFMEGVIQEVTDPFDNIVRAVKVNISGDAKSVEELYQKLEKYIKSNDVFVHWWFKAKDELSSVRFTLEDSKSFKSEHYPFLPDAGQFINDFIASPANILILLGEPGTGKTSFIRHLLKTSGSECFVTYDENVMMNDQLYTTFLTNREAKFLVLEDADLIMTDRQRDGNRIMSKILNAADGLISFQQKKIIFTANIRDTGKIDDALMRPGRCFGVVNFRELDTQEAQAVAQIHEITLKTAKPHTLAQLFNQ
jgi:hypothetical protein